MKNNTLPTKKMTMTIMYTGCYACTPNQEIMVSHLLGSGAGREEPGIERWWGEVRGFLKHRTRGGENALPFAGEFMYIRTG